MQEYVDKEGDSVLEAWRQCAEQVIIDEATGRVVEGAVNVAGNIGGWVLDNLADRYHGKAEWVARNLDEAHECLTQERHLWGSADDAARAASWQADDVVARAASRAGDDAGRSTAGHADDAARAAEGTPRMTQDKIDKLKNDIRQRLDNYEAQRTNPQQLPASMETNKLNLSADEVARRGITPHEQQVLKDVSKERGAIIDVRGRTSNVSSMIENEIAVPKGENVHVRTVKEIEIEYLGYDRNTKDLVVFRRPDPLPLSKPPDMSARDWRELRTDHAQRTSEFINEQANLQELVRKGEIHWDPTLDGIVYDGKTGLPLTSDIDGFMIRDAANPHLPACS